MLTMISSSNLTIEKTFQRLLFSTEKHLEEKSIEDWKVNQFVNSLTKMLNVMYESMNRPSKKQLDEYKQRIDRIRQNIDPIKLENQTFPRQILQKKPTDLSVQQTEVTTSVIVSTPIEKSLHISNKTERPNLNRQQQHIQTEEDKQDDIAISMRITTQSLLNTGKRLNDVVIGDQKKLIEAENLIDNNTAKLHIQSKRLKQNAYSGSNCWIYLMLILVIITFIYLTLFMRMFRKRIITIIDSNIGTKSSLLNNPINQTTINNTNITTTKSTDYISLLLNYANENHTDL